jgi:hypothetical protein
MQENDYDERKKRALLALVNMVQQTMKKQREMYWSPRNNKTFLERKDGLRAQGGILTPSHAFGKRKLQKLVLGGRIILRIRNLAIHIGEKSAGNISDCNMNQMR